MPIRFLSDLAGTLRSQFRIKPAAATGAPTAGSHQIGELHMDSTAALFVCVSTGTPGTWQAAGGSLPANRLVSVYSATDLTIGSTISYAEYTGPGGHTFTLFAANISASFSAAVLIKNHGSGSLTVAATGLDTLEDGSSSAVTLTAGQSRWFIANMVNAWSVN